VSDVRRALLAGVSGASLLLAAAAWPALAWLVLAPLVAASRRNAGRRASALLGVAFTLPFASVAHAAWLADTAQRYFSLPPAGALAAALLLCVGCAVPSGVLLGLGLRGTCALRPALVVPACAALWVVWESLTRMTFPYYPWIGLAATQTTVGPVLQAASVAGQDGLSWIVAATGSALGVALTTRRRNERWGALAAAAAVVATTLLLGGARLRAAPANVDRPLCTVAAIDADIPGPDLALDDLLARYTATSARGARSSPDAVVWPESALTNDPLLDPSLLGRLRAIAAAAGGTLIVGGPRQGWDATWQPLQHNTLYRIPSDGPVTTYDKRAPVPFAETWPALLPRPGWPAPEDVASGTDAVLLAAGACRLGALICFEAERAGLAADYVARGADALLVASNDAELPPSAVASELAQARLRAVETGLPVLRAANRGANVAIDRYGRVVASGVVALLAVPPAVPAPAVRWSRVLLALCWLTAVTVALPALRRRARR